MHELVSGRYKLLRDSCALIYRFASWSVLCPLQGGLDMTRLTYHEDRISVSGIPSRHTQYDNRLQFVDWELADWPLIYAGAVDQSLMLEMLEENARLPQIVGIDNAVLRARLQDIRLSKTHKPFELGKRLEGVRHEVEVLLDENADTLTENAGVRLKGWTTTGGTIDLSIQPVGFRALLSSNMQMDRKLQSGKTLRAEIHPRGVLEPLGMSILANPLGVDILLFTNDGRMVVQKRSERMAVRPGALAPSVSGGFDWGDVSSDDVETLADVPIWREMVEELGVNQGALSDLQFLGITRELARGGQPEAFFSGCVDMSEKELLKRWGAAEDSWEASQLRFYPIGELAIRQLNTATEYEMLHQAVAKLNEEMLEEASVTLQANISLWLLWKRGEIR